MNHLFTYIIAPLVGAFLPLFLQAQGCVAIRGMGACSAASSQGGHEASQPGKFLATANYRYFRSFKHFRGDHQERERVENHTEVVNLSHSLELGLTYAPNNRLSFSVNIPLLHNDRSSLYEHYGNALTANPEQKRFHTGSKGIGDMRLSSSFWLIHPDKGSKFNMTLGGGLKLPTGNKAVVGTFHKLTQDGQDYTIERPVDQSIQLGDGVVGFFLESQGYLQLNHRMSFYYNGFYLSNPAGHNGVVRNPQATAVDPVTGYLSAADQFAARLGGAVMLGSHVTLTLGGRLEGIPSSDLIGNDQGFRRPGYVVSAEPGFAITHGKMAVNLSVPVALYRNRTKSYADKQDITGKTHGDAAFADYLISVGISRWF